MSSSLALQLAASGARLALSDIDANGLTQTLRLLPSGTDVRGYKLDVSSRDAVFTHANDVKRDFGFTHFVFNNAGTTIVGTFENLDIDEIEWQLGINLWGVIYGSKAFLPTMLAQRDGCIVNISSVFGFIGFPAQSAYNISKFGVRGLTECLWRELEGTGVRAVSVHPGGIKTNIERVGRRCKLAGEKEAGFSALAAKLLTTPPEKCAANILKGVQRGKKRVVTGNQSAPLFWLSRLMPNNYHSVVKLIA
ncbi:SDR family oxidoreductase [Variovorax sp. J22R133]|uniref:SDR family NAD(P)-dependent oxidoreductase n=1 Tax=Variovorax brevis TaxID=3053503 RepID=UPI00257737C0|nr:SDR family oxidoreductase [Variovorax sp. J22R133]MDM0110552.1 SDR family oxidoreductase [Variovorax sp. J22R133]